MFNHNDFVYVGLSINPIFAAIDPMPHHSIVKFDKYASLSLDRNICSFNVGKSEYLESIALEHADCHTDT